jgi:transposase
MIRYVGLDVHRENVVVCIMNAAGEVLRPLTVPCTRGALEAFARAHLTEADQLVLEATFNCWAVLAVLRPFVARVAVSNPLTTKAIAQSKVKTDKVDARVLADLLRCGYLPEVWVPDAATQQQRTLTHRRATLVSERTRLKNRIHGILAQALIPRYEGDLFSQAGQRWLADQPLSELERQVMESDKRLLALVEAELAALDAILVRQAYVNEQVRLLMTLPGVDYTVALGVLSALGDIHRFRDGDHAASYFGLVPSTRQSADRCYHGPITRRGSRHARWLLIQAAQHAGKHPGPVGVFYRRLRHKKNHNVAVVAAARKLVTIAWQMLTTGEPYRYAQPRLTQEKLARLRIKATGQRKKTGPAKGGKPSPNRGSGVRTRAIPALKEVCREENLPAPRGLEELPAGERRALAAAGVEEYVRSLQSEHREPRARKVAAKPAAGEDAEGASKGELLA